MEKQTDVTRAMIKSTRNSKYSFMPYNYIAHERLRTAALNNTTPYVHALSFYALLKLLKPQNVYLDWHFVNIYFSPASSFQTLHSLPAVSQQQNNFLGGGRGVVLLVENWQGDSDVDHSGCE